MNRCFSFRFLRTWRERGWYFGYNDFWRYRWCHPCVWFTARTVIYEDMIVWIKFRMMCRSPYRGKAQWKTRDIGL